MLEIVSFANHLQRKKPNNGQMIQRLLKVVQFSAFFYFSRTTFMLLALFVFRFYIFRFAPFKNRKFNVELNTEKK